jgi:hypothetical protein
MNTTKQALPKGIPEDSFLKGTATRKAKRELPDDEKIEKGQHLAQAQLKLTELELEKKTITKGFNVQIKEQKDIIDALSPATATGFINEDYKAEVYVSRNQAKKYYVKDGVVLETVQATAEDYHSLDTTSDDDLDEDPDFNEDGDEKDDF